MNQLAGNGLYAGEINYSSWVPVPWSYFIFPTTVKAAADPLLLKELHHTVGGNVQALQAWCIGQMSKLLWIIFEIQRKCEIVVQSEKIVNYIEHMYIVLIPINEFSGRWCSQCLFFQSSSSCTFIGWLRLNNHRVSYGPWDQSHTTSENAAGLATEIVGGLWNSQTLREPWPWTSMNWCLSKKCPHGTPKSHQNPSLRA